jgi:hypothetical protein
LTYRCEFAALLTGCVFAAGRHVVGDGARLTDRGYWR